MAFSKSIFQLSAFILCLTLANCKTFSSASLNLARAPQDAFDLKTLDGNQFDLQKTIKEHDATILVWWATQCPCVQRFQTRMHDLRHAYAEDSVAIVAISSNVDDDLSRLRQVAKERGFELPVISDGHANLANTLSVTTTPTVVLIDNQGNLRFKGWIDNERQLNQSGRVAYLQNAIDELLAGKEIAVQRSPTYGCMITKSL